MIMNSESEWTDILRKVEKPGRYVGGEWNSIRKDPSRVQAKIALVFPDIYEIGMSYLGQKVLYAALNAKSRFLAERVFAPWPDLENELRSGRRPIFSLENRLPLDAFDIIGFSLLYELNYSNILTILDLGRIPFASADRGELGPLVIAGGPAVFNPEPLTDIFDAFFLGDGEDGFIEIADKYIEWRQGGGSKADLLNELAGIEGVYVPRLYDSYQPPQSHLLARRPGPGQPARVKKRVLSVLTGESFPAKIVVPDIQAVFDRVAIEVARGCPQRCRFCQATSIYFPFRAMSPSAAISKIRRSLDVTGFEDISLSALSISDYPYLEETVNALMRDLARRKVSLSLSSLRPRGLTSGIADNILRVRKTGFTLVPEAGTDRLRRVINKDIHTQEILEAAANAFSRGWRLLKLYFMVGLPTETEADLAGLVELTGEIVKVGRSILKSAPRINLSLSSFIPKPHTPFQWLRMAEEGELIDKQRLIRSRLHRFPSVRIKDHPTKISILEGVFSRGERRLGSVLAQAWRRGARFDSWKDHFVFSRWEDAFTAEGLDYRAYLRALDVKAVLPWDHVDPGIGKDFLLSELRKALRAETTPSCLEASCADCGGCPPDLRTGKSFVEKINVGPSRFPTFGRKSDNVIRYEMFYSKDGSARFFSHRDIVNHIQRAFRRAGIEPAFSEGFHPHMIVSYAPALALGMKGKAECLEFRSPHEFDEKSFVRRVNRFVREGIRVRRLRRLADAERPLSDRLRAMVFCLDLKNPDVQTALAGRREGSAKPAEDEAAFVRRRMAEILSRDPTSGTFFWLDKGKRRLFLQLSLPSPGRLRPQDIIEELSGLETPAHYLTREKFVFAQDERSSV
jgi:radical SAM family uncharacterized protein/radical SAM-linked protein